MAKYLCNQNHSSGSADQFLPSGSITTKQESAKLHEFVTFVCLVYSSWWNISAAAVDAPWNDVHLFKKTQHRKVDETRPCQ